MVRVRPTHWALVALTLCALGVRALSGAQGPGNQPRYVPHEVLVQFKPGTTSAARRSAGLAAGEVQSQMLAASAGGPLEVLSVALPVDEAIALLENDDRVLFAEPNWIYTHQAASNDPRFLDGSLWGVYGDRSTPANTFGTQASEAWARGLTGSSTVYVAVIDEGIDFTHPDLAANIWTNPFDPIDGIDNDGNGRIDDIHGWDFFGNNNSIFDGGPGSSIDRHGTHVSGTIGAIGGNGVGVAGVNWNVTLISAKFLGPFFGLTSSAVAALNYITDLKLRHGLNIVAANNSWGGGGYSQALHDAIIRAAKAGILFVAAAGNGDSSGNPIDNDRNPFYPANYDTRIGTSTESAASFNSVISVAAMTSTGARSSFSNYGATTVGLGAPGSGILSTTPNNTYSSLSGTSMATPHVTGAVALYTSVFPTATASDVKNAIVSSTLPTASLAGITVSGGRVNLGSVGLPLPPATVKSHPPDTSISQPLSLQLEWLGGIVPHGDEYCYDTTDNGSCDAGWISTGSTATATLDGLHPATTYFWQVRTRNDAGTTPADNGVWWRFTTRAMPPSAFATTSPLNAATGLPATVALMWQSSAWASGYQYCVDTTDNNTCDATWIPTGSTTHALVGGLAASTTYYWQVRAQNGAGVTEANAGTWRSFTRAATADKPWSGLQHDARRTGRSTGVGPKTPTERWDFATDGVPGSPAIESDGTIYLPVGWLGTDANGYLYAINPDGTLKWRATLQFLPSSTAPAIAPDGTIYVHGTSRLVPEVEQVCAVTPAGTILWTFTALGGRLLPIHSSPVVASDGTVYVGISEGSGWLYAFNPNGSVKWRRSDSFYESTSSPTLGADETVYLHTYDGLYAYAPDGTLKWNTTHPSGIAPGSPAIGSDGVVYYSHLMNLHAVAANGVPAWNRPLPASPVLSTPAIGVDGSIVVSDLGLAAWTREGDSKWRTVADGTGMTSSSPIIAGDGTIYVRTSDAYRAYEASGALMWQLPVSPFPSNGLDPAGALSLDGTLYVPYTGGTAARRSGLRAYVNEVGAPTSFRATTASRTQIDLAWTDNATDETSYRVERSLNGTSWSEIASLARNAAAFSDTMLTCETRYHYRVRAHRSPDNQFSAYIEPQTATTLACPPLSAPSALTATPVSATEIALAWSDNASDETSLRVERSLNGVHWTEIVATATNAIAHADRTVTCNTRYHYRVRAHRFADDEFSTYAEPQAATTTACSPEIPPPPPSAPVEPPEPARPNAPAALTAVSASAAQIDLTWVDTADDETSVRVERSPDAIAWSEIASLTPNAVAFGNTPLTCDTTYHYRLRAHRASDNRFSSYSVTASATTHACPAPGAPSAPHSFRATLTGSTLLLHWGAPIEGGPPLEYVLQAALDPQFGAIIYHGGTGSTATAMMVPGVPPGVFYLRVFARNFAGPSSPSNVQQIGGGGSLLPPGRPVPPPGAPTLVAVRSTNNPITLGWSPGAGGAPASYTLLAGLSPGDVSLGAFPMGGATSITAAAPIGLRIFVRVVAINAAGQAVSNEIDFVVGATDTPGARHQ